MVRRSPPPRDSWIQIGPGDSFLFDEPAVRKTLTEVARFGREVRGTLLASAYEIEWTLDQVLLGAFFVGQEEHPSPGRKIFDDLLLKRGPLNLSYKVRLLREAIETIPALKKLVPGTLLADLQSVRTIRNDFAHYPVSLRPDGPEPITKLKPILAGAESDTELSDVTVKGFFELFGRVTTQLNELVRQLNEGALKEVSSNIQPQSDAPPAGGTPLA